jgi:hypothetical protein
MFFEYCYAECHDAECHNFFVMPNVTMLNVVMQNVTILSVIMLNGFTLSVMAPVYLLVQISWFSK